jgi:D-ribose pyranose/furanose isomerase RbsD
MSAAWEERLNEVLPLYGHRNWIVVADAAYPMQSNSGIETIATGAEQLEVVKAVFESVDAAAHVRAHVWVDREFGLVKEEDAAGVEAYRRELKKLFAKADIVDLPHEQIIAKLDEAARLFKILLLKTTMTIPYTTVFFELDCGYWSPKAEKRLRKAMGA